MIDIGEKKGDDWIDIIHILYSAFSSVLQNETFCQNI